MAGFHIISFRWAGVHFVGDSSIHHHQLISSSSGKHLLHTDTPHFLAPVLSGWYFHILQYISATKYTVNKPNLWPWVCVQINYYLIATTSHPSRQPFNQASTVINRVSGAKSRASYNHDLPSQRAWSGEGRALHPHSLLNRSRVVASFQ